MIHADRERLDFTVALQADGVVSAAVGITEAYGRADEVLADALFNEIGQVQFEFGVTIDFGKAILKAGADAVVQHCQWRLRGPDITAVAFDRVIQLVDFIGMQAVSGNAQKDGHIRVANRGEAQQRCVLEQPQFHNIL